MGKYEKSLQILKDAKKANLEYDKPESGGMAIMEARLSATHHFLNNKTESIEHAEETLKRVKAMQKVDPSNVGESEASDR